MSKRTQAQPPQPQTEAQPTTTSTNSPTAREEALLRWKIQPRHRERLAVVYVRQSTQQQVLHHRESRERQYALAEHAKRLGWPQDQIVVIDDDLGMSGRRAEDRQGFQRLLLEVNLDHVGMILGLVMNRLACSSKDWQHLFEVCAIFNTLLADEDGAYTPNDPNDRLLLGLKGILSEVELHTMRVRLQRGCQHKAERGALYTIVPIGYVRSASGAVELDPDEQVQSVVKLIFAKFDELGSAAAVFRYLHQHEIRIGVRSTRISQRGHLEWRPAQLATVTAMLHHPIYAGAYVHGRRQTDAKDKAQGRYRSHPSLDQKQWEVLIKDHLPSYISWEQFLANQNRLADNRSRKESKGAPRTGSCLLGGLIHCRHCGDRLKITYRSDPKRRRVGLYGCRRSTWDPQAGCAGGARVQAEVIDNLVAEQLLQALEPAALALSLQAAQQVERERQQLEQLWQQRLERARYEVERAFRQYNTVEPENRLVARTLEQRWEEALRQQRELEAEHDRFQREHAPRLTRLERERIEALSQDLPALWSSSSLTHSERKEIVRLLIERVEVAVNTKQAQVPVTIHWVGGHASEHQVCRRVGSYDRTGDFAQLRSRLLALRDEAKTAAAIAASLNEEGFRPARGSRQFTPAIVLNLLTRLGANVLPHRKLNRRMLRQDEWTLAQLVKKLKVKHGTLMRWCRVGWVQTRRLPGAANRWIVWADADELNRLRRLRDQRPDPSKPQRYPRELTTPKPRPEEGA